MMRVFLLASATDLEGIRSAVLLTLLLPVAEKDRLPSPTQNFARLQKNYKFPAPP